MNAYYIVLISAILFMILAAFGMFFPKSRHDWKKDRTETVGLITSLIVFIFLFMLLWYVVSVIAWPTTMDMLIWSSIIIFLILLVAAIFLPHGLMLEFGKKKDKNVKTADDDE